MIVRLHDLPQPPAHRTGWPWTQERPPLPPTLANGNPWPRITLVTPSYKQAEFLEETLRSVLLQGYPNLEYIVMDGGSLDGSVEIIKKYAPFISYWTSVADNGQSEAINKGFARGTGEIMGWLNSDDILLPDALRHVAEAFAASPDTMIITGFRKIYDKSSQFLFNYIRDLPTSYYLRHYCSVAQETTYWRRSVWEKLGPLDEDFHYAMDYEYWLRMIHNGYSIHIIPYYLGGFRQYAETKTLSKRDIYYRDVKVIYERYNMGHSEAEILADLGPQWSERLRLLTDLGFKAISNYPRLVIAIFNFLERPNICAVALAYYRRYRRYRPLATQDKVIPAWRHSISNPGDYLIRLATKVLESPKKTAAKVIGIMKTMKPIPAQKPPVHVVNRPWGSFKQFAHNQEVTVSLMVVQPGQRLSLQSHTGRAELWVILDDGATVQVGDEIVHPMAGDEIWIPAESKHRLSSDTETVRVLEVAFGNWQQDDITRYADDYGRPDSENP